MKKSLWRGDRKWITLFVMVDTLLIVFALLSYRTLNEITVESRSPASVSEESQRISQLSQVAREGDWTNLEATRREQALVYLSTHQRPTNNAAVYFYPETLPDHSLEKEFAIHELMPSIEALRDAATHQQREATSMAYKRLRSRVENYELGANQPPEELSPEAQQFLKTYQTLTQPNAQPGEVRRRHSSEQH